MIQRKKRLQLITAGRCTVLGKVSFVIVLQITTFPQNQCLFLQKKPSRLCFHHAFKQNPSPFPHALRIFQTFSKLPASSESASEHSSKPTISIKALELIVSDFKVNEIRGRKLNFLGNTLTLSDLRAE